MSKIRKICYDLTDRIGTDMLYTCTLYEQARLPRTYFSICAYIVYLVCVKLVGRIVLYVSQNLKAGFWLRDSGLRFG